MEWFIYFVDAKGKKSNFGWNIIKFFADSPLVHVGLAFKEDGEYWVYETTSSKFVRRNLKTRAKGTTLKMFRINHAGGAMARSYLTTLIGQPYDYPAILGLGIFLLAERVCNWILAPVRWLCNTPDTKLRIRFHNPYNINAPWLVYCVESVLEAFEEAGIQHPFGDTAAVMPQLLFNFCLTEPEVFKFVQAKELLKNG